MATLASKPWNAYPIITWRRSNKYDSLHFSALFGRTLIEGQRYVRFYGLQGITVEEAKANLTDWFKRIAKGEKV